MMEANAHGILEAHSEHPKISVLIPAYNEAEHLEGSLREVERVLKAFSLDYELIVIDDGSSDNTLRIARAYSSKKVRVLTNGKNLGKGAAMLRGINEARGEYITFIDADLDIHPSTIYMFMRCMAENGADAIIGSKRHPRSRVIYPFTRKFLSKCYNIFIRLFFGLQLSDTQAGFKLFKSSALRRVYPSILSKRYAFDLELLVNFHRLGYRIAEAPIDLQFVRFSSRIRLKDIWCIFVDTCAIFYRLKILKHYTKMDSQIGDVRLKVAEKH